ncbi:hypothetical protein ACS0TY_016038 [Phlomoides rotata]
MSTAAGHYSSSDDLELLSIDAAAAPYTYSSLKDLLPPTAALYGSDICIRNPLVRQAARAYLRPMSVTPDSTSGNIFHCLWRRVAVVIDFCRRSVIRVLDGTFRVVWIRSSGNG